LALNAQPTLFDVLYREVEKQKAASEQAGWERRYLSELADTPTVCCYPGLAGSYHESLVRQGLATREDAGFMPFPDPTGMMEHGKIITPKRAKVLIKEYWESPDPMFRYSITLAGRAILQSMEADHV
jgi:hypothetical protein